MPIYIRGYADNPGLVTTTEETDYLSLQRGSSVSDMKIIRLSNFFANRDNAISGKVDKVTGKALSENDFTDPLKNKLNGIEAEAEANDLTEEEAGELSGGGNTELHTHDMRYYTVAEMDNVLGPMGTRLSGLDTLVYEGVTYRMSRSIENGHLVTHYTEVI